MTDGERPNRVKVSVVLPTYDEAANIGPLIERLSGALAEDFELVVVDDDSPDGTWAIVEKLAATQPNVRLLRRQNKRGLTSALRDGIAAARGEIIVWLDCDLSMPPEMVPQLVAAVESGYDLAVGSRFVRGGGILVEDPESRDRPLAVILSRALNYGIQFLLDSGFKDYTSGFIAARRQVVEEIDLRGDYGEYFIDLMYRAIQAGYRCIEIPYVCLPRREGVSKTGTNLWQYLKRGRKYVTTALGLRLFPPRNAP